MLRNGLIEAVGADVAVAGRRDSHRRRRHDGVPGPHRHGERAGLDAAPPAPPATFRTLEDAERFKRSVILRPELEAAKVLRPDAPELSRLRGGGRHDGPRNADGGTLQRPERPRQRVGAGRRTADRRRRRPAARPAGRSHAGGAARLARARAGRRRGGGGYPVSLLGSIAFVRQSFLDAQHQQLEKQRYEKAKTGVDAARLRSVARRDPAGAGARRCRWRSKPTCRARFCAR